MTYLVDGELVDTYGGDYTYKDVWYEIEDGEIVIYKSYSGAKSSPTERVYEPDEIEEYMPHAIRLEKERKNDI